MKKMLFASLLLALPLVSQAAPNQAQQDFVKYLLKSGKEPAVKDASWLTDQALYIGAKDNGQRQDQLSVHLCAAAAKQGANAGTIKIVDIDQIATSKGIVELGKATCK